MQHPNSLDLEAFAVGDAISSVAEHVAACDACASFIERVRATSTAHAAKRSPRIVVAKAQRAERARIAVGAMAIFVPLAAAAAIALWVRPPSGAAVTPGATGQAASASAVAMVAPGPSDPETTFKGAVQIAVVRERAGTQARFTSVVKVRPGDRLRVEVALDREQAILAAVIGEDDSYLELMPAVVRGAGTHFSERSARVDDRPTAGFVVVGTAEAIARARRSTGQANRFDGVARIHIELEATP